MRKCRSKTMSLLLTAALWLLLPVIALAAPWDGTADTGWFFEGRTEFAISTPEQLAGIGKLVSEGKSDFKGVTIKLTADLDLGGEKGANGKWGGQVWRAVCPRYGNEFLGVIDGNGHKISNIYSVTGDNEYCGLLGSFGGTVKNLTVESGYIDAGVDKDAKPVGAVAGILREGGRMENCVNKAEVSGKYAVGGIVGRASSGTRIIACLNEGNIFGDSEKVGGVVGDISGNGGRSSIYGCANTGRVVGEMCVGGVAGASVAATVADSYSTGEVTATGKKGLAGGLIGAADSGAGSNIYTGSLPSYVIGCYAAGKVSAPAAADMNVGLFCGNNDLRGYGKNIAVGAGAMPALGVAPAADDKDKSAEDAEEEAADIVVVEVMDKTALVSFPNQLGKNYAANSAVKGGLPQLAWQQGGELDFSEDTELAVADIVDVSPTGCTVVFNRLPKYSDIAVARYRNSETEKEDITLSAKVAPYGGLFGASGTPVIVKYNGEPVYGIRYSFVTLGAGKNVTFTAAYLDKTPVTRSLTVPQSDLWSDYFAADFAGGSGTAADPYKIATPEQLARLSYIGEVKRLSKSALEQILANIKGNGDFIWAELTADLDMGAHKWTAQNFTGHLDGKGHTVSNMRGESLFNIFSGALVNMNFADCQSENGGMVAEKLSGNVANCHINNCVISGDALEHSYAGALGGYAECAGSQKWLKIADCSVTNTTINGQYAGGLIAYFNNGNESGGSILIQNCLVSADLCANNDSTYALGGIIGNVYYTRGVTIENCVVEIKKAGQATFAGGLIGRLDTSNSKLLGADGLHFKNNAVSGSGLVTADPSRVNALLSGLQILVDAGSATSEGNYINAAFTLCGQKVAADPAVGLKLTDSVQLPEFSKDKLSRVEFLWAQQPKNTTVYTNCPAYMAVSPVGGLNKFSYQWQVYRGGGWQNIAGATDSLLEIKYADKYANGSLFRCVVKDANGYEAPSNSAKLTVSPTAMDAKLARDVLAWHMMADGSLDTPGEAFALAAAGKNPQKLENNSSVDELYGILDCFPLQLDLREYTYNNGLGSETWDWVERLALQQKAGGAINTPYYGGLQAVIALDIYFNGGDWGADFAEEGKGRKPALDALMNQVEEQENIGRMFYDISPYENESSIISNSTFVQLAARLADDPVYGKTARERIPQVLDGLTKFYQLSKAGAEQNIKPITSVKAMASFVSALSAGAEATADKQLAARYRGLAAQIINTELLPSRSIGDGYSRELGQHDLQPSAQATVAVLQALADYTNGSAYANYTYDVPGKIAVREDLNSISFPKSISGDVKLLTRGTFGSVIQWQSSAPEIIATNGKVTRGAARQEVTLTATASKKGVSASRSFVLPVRAVGADNQDDVNEAIAEAAQDIAHYKEVINSIELPKSKVAGVSFKWASSDESVLAADGTVKRPAAGQEDKKVTLTLTAEKSGAQASVSQEMLVWAASDLKTQEGKLREFYIINRTGYMAAAKTNGYWDVWAAYAVLGDYIADPANGFENKLPMPESDWYGTQYGAMLMGICAIGENPYNYKDLDWVQLCNDNYGGPWAGAMYSALGMEAVGANPAVYTHYKPENAINATGQTQSMGSGIDIAGWAAVLLANHLDYSSSKVEQANYFVDYLMNTKGIAEDGNFAGCNYISTGCGVMGLSALSWAGMDEADPLGGQWKNSKTGLGLIDVLYDTMYGDNGKNIGYGGQLCVSLGDLYTTKYLGGKPTWLAVAVSRDKLDKQIALADEIIAEGGKYTPESLARVESALQTVKALPEARLAMKVPDWGKEYYDLYDAVRFVELQK